MFYCNHCSSRFYSMCTLHKHLVDQLKVSKYVVDLSAKQVDIIEYFSVTYESRGAGLNDSDLPLFIDETYSPNNTDNNNLEDNLTKCHCLTENENDVDSVPTTVEKSRMDPAMCISEEVTIITTGHETEKDILVEELAKSNNIQKYTDNNATTCDILADYKVEAVTKNLPQKLPCDRCGLLFSKRNLRRHQESHALEKTHTCDICNKRFSTSGQLYGHKLHHITNKNHVCEQCGKTFNNRPNLRQHQKSHTSERKYTCTVCSKTFKSNSVLKDHVLRHSEHKPHACVKCRWSFRKPQELKRHMIVHSEERPHQCSVCNRSFKSRSNRIKHEKVHDKC